MPDDTHNTHQSADTGSGEGICWRPWPCASCCGSPNPIDYLIGSYRPSEKIPDGDRNQVIEWLQNRESKALLEWVAGCSHSSWKALNLPKIGEGSEHLVFLDQPSGDVVKVTREGLYGDYYEIVDGRIHQFNCTPLEYFFRSAWWNALISLAPMPFAVSSKGQILTRQQFIKGEPPTQEKVDDFLMQSGWLPVRQECWLWKREIEGSDMDCWLGDARADNFVSLSEDIVPIDIRIWALPLKSHSRNQL